MHWSRAFRLVCEVGLWATSHTSQELWPWNCESPQESVRRPSQGTSKNHVVRSQTLKYSVKSYVTGPSTKCYFDEFIFMQILTHDKIELTNGSERSECHGLPVLCQAYLQEVVFEKTPSDHETWSIRCHVRIHVYFYIHLEFTYSVGPSSGVWSSELGPAPPFPPMRMLKVSWSRAINESAQSVLAMGCQSRVWRGPWEARVINQDIDKRRGRQNTCESKHVRTIMARLGPKRANDDDRAVPHVRLCGGAMLFPRRFLATNPLSSIVFPKSHRVTCIFRLFFINLR